MALNPEDLGGNEKMWRKVLNPLHPTMKLIINFIFILADVCNSLTTDNGKVSHSGHLIGGITGLIVGFAVLENKVEKRWETIMRICIGSFCTLFLFSLIISHIVLTFVPIDGVNYLFPDESMSALGGKCT